MRQTVSLHNANPPGSSRGERQTVAFRHETPVGPMRSTWNAAGLHSLTWIDAAEAEHLPAVENTSSAGPSFYGELNELDDRLSEYFECGRADFSSIKLDDRDWPPFTRTVYECCRSIAAGSTVTYQELARRAGNGSASRAVGAAMARNRVLLVIPCHRVLSGGGNLRGFSGPGGIQTKQFLLDLEAA